MNDTVLILINGAIALGTALSVAHVNKRKDRQDREEKEVIIFEKVRNNLSEEIKRLENHTKDLEEHIEKNTKHIRQLEKEKQKDKLDHQNEINLLRRDNELCKYQHEVARLEMAQLRKLTLHHKPKFDEVFVLDDDDDVLDEFKDKFDNITVIQYEGFRNIETFLIKTKVRKPSIVVLDYKLGAVTAEEVIDQLGYEPEIFIMSGEKGFQARFAGKRIRFFEKEQDYVFKIAIAIIKHLNDKN